MLKLLANLKAKDTYFFELVKLPVNQRDFTYFYNLADYLGEQAGTEPVHCKEIGLMSELIYLYSLLHYRVSEVTAENEDFRSTLQMPVLLGDLLLGRFYEAMAECNKNDCLDEYVAYIRNFSANQLDDIDGGNSRNDAHVKTWVKELSEVTAMAVHKYGKKEATDTSLQKLAEEYMQEHWDTVGTVITTQAQLQDLLRERA